MAIASLERPKTHSTTCGVAVVYCRVSTRKQEDEGTSLDSQAEACVRFAEKLGYTVSTVVREVYTGAELWDRPQLSQLRASVRAKEVQAVIAYATDRLSRDPIHLAIVADECERRGVALHFVTEPLDSSDEGRLILYVKGYAAKIEREKIKERMMRGRHQRLIGKKLHVSDGRRYSEDGKLHSWGSELYGYRRDNEAGVRHIHAEEARVVREMYRWVDEEGLSLRAVRQRLNDRGIPSPGAGKLTFREPGRVPAWGKTQVRRLLTDPSFKGETYVMRWDGRGGKGNPQLRDESEWIRLPDGTTPAIVDADRWDRVQRHLAENRGNQTRNQARPFLLRGMIICAVCGRKMRADVSRGVRVYRCSSRETPAGPCGGKAVPADDGYSFHALPRDEKGHPYKVGDPRRGEPDLPGIETAVWAKVRAMLDNPAIIEDELERLRHDGPDTQMLEDLESVKRSLAAIERKQERLIAQFSNAPEDDSLWKLVEREVKRLEKEKRDLLQMRTTIEARLQHQEVTQAQLRDIAALGEGVGQRLESADFEQRRRALEALEEVAGIVVIGNGRTATLEVRLDGLQSLAGDLDITSCGYGRNSCISLPLDMGATTTGGRMKASPPAHHGVGIFARASQ